MTSAYEDCRRLLDAAGIAYIDIEHEPEGQTEAVSLLRGHPVSQAAKCIILIVKIGKKHTRFVLAVIRGDGKIDMNRIRDLYSATYVGFAGRDVAERLAGSPMGTVLPFAMTEELAVLTDPALIAQDMFYFNAARLDRSLAMRSEDYVAFAKPRIESIASY